MGNWKIRVGISVMEICGEGKGNNSGDKGNGRFECW